MSGTMDISDTTGQESVQENITENNKMEEVDSTEQSEESHIEQTPQEIEMENALEALKLMEKLENDKTQYEVHVQLIETLKQANLPNELEAARLNMHEIYPLSEGLWLDWINDTKKEADTEEGREKLMRLYNEAQEDYLSLNIWKSYVRYILDNFHAKFDSATDEATELIDSTRKDLLHAVRATQFHIKQSQEIWKPFAEFELEILNKFKQPEQQKRVKEIILSRLAVLHIDYQDTFDTFSSFVSTWDNSNYENTMKEASKIYAKTKSAAEERDIFEMKIVSSGYSLDAFYEYIENEKISKFMTSVNNVRCLYERAIVYYCTDPALWDDYILYLIEKGRVFSLLNTVTLRAIRNCPWSGTLYAHRARLLESEKATEDQMNDLFDTALGSKLLLSSMEDLITLLLAKIDHVRRKIDWEDGKSDEEDIMNIQLAFMESLEYLQEAFPDSGDPYYRVEKYYAYICTKRLNDVEKAREIWESTVKNHGRDTEAWLQYITFERDQGNYQACETLFKKAMQKNVDNPVRLIDAWNTMEREVGTLETCEKAAILINRKVKGFSRQWQAALAAQEEVNEAKEAERKEIEKRKKGLHRMEQKKKQKERKAANPTEFRKPLESDHVKKPDDFKKPHAIKTDYKKPVDFVKPAQDTTKPQETVNTQVSQEKSDIVNNIDEKVVTMVKAEETLVNNDTMEAATDDKETDTKRKRKASEDDLKEEDAKKHKVSETEETKDDIPVPRPIKAFNPRPRATRGVRGGRGKSLALSGTRSLSKQDAHPVPEPTAPDASSKTNDDFRNMLLGKK